jgi:tetratricopeptide (TPR) repeat protein
LLVFWINTAASGRLDPGPNPRRIEAPEFCSDLLKRMSMDNKTTGPLRGAWPDPLWAIVGAIALAGLVFVAYLPVIHAGFIWDDDKHITNSAVLMRSDGLALAWRFPQIRPPSIGPPQYYPLTHTSFWLESHIWGLDPHGYHLDNILLHAASAVLLWLVLWRLRVAGAWIAGTWVAAALWALHPVQVESVAWITERKNTLSLFLELAALLAYQAFEPGLQCFGAGAAREEQSKQQRHWDSYALALLFFVAALLAKTVACSLPLVILILIWWKRGRIRAAEVLPLVPMFLMGGALGLYTGYLERVRVGALGPEWQIPAVDRLLIAGRAIWFDLGKLLWPAGLCFSYSKWNVDAGAIWQWLAPAAVGATLAALWLARRRLGRGPLAGAIIYCIVLGPSLGIADVYPMLFTFVADHYQYAASAAMAALIVGVASRARFGREIIRAGAIVLIAVLALLTYDRSHIFRSAESVWRDTIVKNPGSWLARENLAVILTVEANVPPAEAKLGEDSDTVAHRDELLGNDPATFARGRLLEAASLYAEVSTLRPLHDYVDLNWGDALLGLKQYDAAIARYRHRLEIAKLPNGPELTPTALSTVYRKIAGAQDMSGRHEESLASMRQAVADDPNSMPVRIDLARELARMHRIDEAVAQVIAATNGSDANGAHWRDAAWLLWQIGRPAQMQEVLDEYLARFPGDLDGRLNIGAFFMENNRPEEAEKFFRAALVIDPNCPQALAELARLGSPSP